MSVSKIIAACCLLVGVFLLHGKEHTTPASSAQPGHKSENAGAIAARTHDVTIENFKFIPDKLEIQVGDTVIWTNKDAAPHTATRTANPAFDTGLLSKGKSKAIQFTTPSSSKGFEYLCVPHPTMTGTIIVKSPGSFLSNVGDSNKPRRSGDNVAVAPPISATVKIKDTPPYYEPAAVEITVGGTVTWVNEGVLPHTASRDAGPAFDTGLLPNGQSKTLRFDQPSGGNGFDYFCRPHPFMQGKVIVKLPGSHALGADHDSAKK